ncbi:hypothetical protein ACQY0O_002295 [Thecaphora frezii]
MAAAAPHVPAPASAKVSLRPASDDAPESLQIRMQKQRIESKFSQVRRDRKAAHALRLELEQTRTNKKTDEQIMLLMQADERLAVLLSQAAESMCALLPPNMAVEGEAGPSSSSATDAPAYGAKAFEIRAQGWFAILNEVQYTLRSAMRHLREAQLAPLTAPVGPEARSTGLAGSADQGHSLSLMDAFVDMSGSDGATFKLPPMPRDSPRRSVLPALDKALSIHALREKDRNWKNLSQSLQEVKQSLDDGSPHSGAAASSPASARQPEQAKTASQDEAIVDALRQGANTDKLLLQALLNASGLSS